MENTPSLPRVGFIGLGLMGGPMALNIAKAGFPLTVFNRTRSKAEALATEVMADVADTPHAVAEASDIVITMVSDVPDVDEVYLTPETGILAAARSGLLCIDMGTIGVAAVQKVASALAEKGTGFVDAPVSGGSWGAQQGTLSIMAGGGKADFDRAVPVFEAMGKRIVHCGETVGDGQKVKLVNQIAVALTTEAVCEGILFAMKSGANVDAALEAIGAGAGSSWNWVNLGPRIAKGDYAPGFKVVHLVKDLRLALQAAETADIHLPGTRMVLSHLEKVLATQPNSDTLGTQALIEALK